MGDWARKNRTASAGNGHQANMNYSSVGAEEAAERLRGLIGEQLQDQRVGRHIERNNHPAAIVGIIHCTYTVPNDDGLQERRPMKGAHCGRLHREGNSMDHHVGDNTTTNLDILVSYQLLVLLCVTASGNHQMDQNRSYSVLTCSRRPTNPRPSIYAVSISTPFCLSPPLLSRSNHIYNQALKFSKPLPTLWPYKCTPCYRDDTARTVCHWYEVWDHD